MAWCVERGAPEDFRQGRESGLVVDEQRRAGPRDEAARERAGSQAALGQVGGSNKEARHNAVIGGHRFSSILMPLSSKSPFLPVLDVWVLLLNLANAGNTTRLGETKKAQKIDAGGYHEHPSGSPVATPQNQASAKESPAASRSNTYNYYYATPESRLAIAGQIAGIVSAVLLALFTFGLWATSIAQWYVARSALYGDRPYLLMLDRPDARFFDPSTREGRIFVFSSARCKFKNLGKGPAILTGIVARMRYADELPLPADFSDCLEIRAFKEPVIEDEGESQFFVPIDGWLVQVQDWKRLLDQEIKVVLYGVVSYEDVFKIKYVTRFAYVYEPPNTALGRADTFRLGRTEYNTRT